MKLAALVEDFPPETDRIHLANGTLFLNGTFTDGKPEIVRCRLPVAYNPNAPSPTRWLAFLDGLLYGRFTVYVRTGRLAGLISELVAGTYVRSD